MEGEFLQLRCYLMYHADIMPKDRFFNDAAVSTAGSQVFTCASAELSDKHLIQVAKL